MRFIGRESYFPVNFKADENTESIGTAYEAQIFTRRIAVSERSG